MANWETIVADDDAQSENGPARGGGGPHGTVVLSPEELPAGVRPGEAGDAPAQPALVGLTPPFTDRRFDLQPERTTIGRDPGNDVALDEPDVSLEHARLVRTGGQWRVVDLNATNGTFINGDLVRQQGVLQYGDHVAFGPAVFVFAAGDTSNEAVRAMQARRGRRSLWWVAGLGVLLLAVVLLVLVR